MRRLWICCTATLLLLSACKEEAKPPSAPAPAEAKPPAEVVAEKAPPPEPETSGPGIIARAAPVRVAMSDEKKLPATEPGGKPVSNWLATLRRGERVTVLSTEDTWAKVKLSDDREGYVHLKSVLVGAVEEATVLEDKPLYERPDLMAIRAGKMAGSGALLLVVKSKDGFSQVNLPEGPDGWVRDADLERSSNEIGVARIVAQIDELTAANKTADAEQLAATARQTYPGAKLLAKLGAGAAPEPEPPVEGGE